MLVYIGLNDDVCPPETGYAVYNAIRSPKELHAQPRSAHDAGRHWVMPKVEAFLAKHLHPAATSRHAEPTVG
jgi:cephalosporin-C deacetylase